MKELEAMLIVSRAVQDESWSGREEIRLWETSSSGQIGWISEGKCQSLFFGGFSY